MMFFPVTMVEFELTIEDRVTMAQIDGLTIFSINYEHVHVTITINVQFIYVTQL